MASTATISTTYWWNNGWTTVTGSNGGYISTIQDKHNTIQTITITPDANKRVTTIKLQFYVTGNSSYSAPDITVYGNAYDTLDNAKARGSTGILGNQGSVTINPNSSGMDTSIDISGLDITTTTTIYILLFSSSTYHYKGTYLQYWMKGHSPAASVVSDETMSVTFTLVCGDGVESFTGGGEKDYNTTVTAKAIAQTGYHLTHYTGTTGTGSTDGYWAISGNPAEDEDSWTMTRDRTITAHAAINSGTVYYYANASDATTKSPHTMTNGKSGTITSVTYDDTAKNLYDVTSLFSRTGYHISSNASAWRYGSATSTTYFNQASQNFSTYLDSADEHGSSFNLYANWKANTYTIKYDKNAPNSRYTVTGTMNNSTHTYNTPKNLTANTYACEGYKFIGWNTAANGSGTSYANSASVKNLTTQNNVTVTLYAQWEPNKASIYIDATNKFNTYNIYIAKGAGGIEQYEQYVPFIYNGSKWIPYTGQDN